MKRTLFVVMALLCLALLTSCAKQSSNVDYKATPHTMTVKGLPQDFEVHTFEYDGCEYIMVYAQGRWSVSHKGNCKHCTDRPREAKVGHVKWPPGQ